jgi:hypothetical protein
MGRRINGCQKPFTFVQVSAWLVQIISLIWFASCSFGFLRDSSASELASTAVIWSVLLVISLSCWFWCQLADPSIVDTKCIVLKQHDSHYCAVCKKSVPGIDHQ